MTSDNGYIGRQVGNYRVTAKLASGAFGSVYTGSHIIFTDRPVVAIKLLHNHLGSQQQRDQFLQEARLLEKLKHPHILFVIDAGIDDDFPYFITEYAPNGSLEERLQRHQSHPLPLEEAITIISQVGQALQYAHQQNIVHRDLKPGNILFNAKDEALLADFGIAAILSTTASTQHASVTGTPSYMAPEQFQGMISKASDQYALGCIAYELFTGHRPFIAPDSIAMGFKHMTETPMALTQFNPQLPEHIERAILRAMAKDRSERHADIAAFVAALRGAIILFDASQNVRGPIYSLPTEKQPTLEFALPTSSANISDSPTASKLSTPGKASISGGDLTEEINPALEKCPYCGAEIYPEAIFCLNCGNRLLPTPLSPQQEQSSIIGSLLAPTFPDLIPADASVLAVVSEVQTPGEAEEVSSVLEPESAPSSHTPASLNSTAVTHGTKELWLEEGNVYYKAKQYEKSLAAYDQVIQLDPHNGHALASKGNALRKLRQYKLALVSYDQALAVSPNDASIWHAKGKVLSRLRRYSEALDACNQALKLTLSNALIWITKGKVLYELSLYDESLLAYDSALAIISNDALIWAAKSEVLHKLERYEDALTSCDRSLAIAPRKALIWAIKGKVLSKLERYDEALEAYHRALILKPNDPSIALEYDMLRKVKRHVDKLAATQLAHQQGTNVSSRNDPSVSQSSSGQISQATRDVRRTTEEVSEVGAGDDDGMVDQYDTGSVTYLDPDLSGKAKQSEAAAEGTILSRNFDVFLSYSHVDAEWVQRLAMRLKDEHDLRVWLDKWMLVPGQPWQQEIARGIEQAGCCAVCIGEHTPEGWFKREIERALNRQAKVPLFGVIPVLLPGASSVNIDDFLGLNTWVNFSSSNPEYAFYLLVCGIKGVPPGPAGWHPEETFIAQKSIAAKIKLTELRQMKQEKLIDPSVAVEFQRIVLQQVWLGIDEGEGKHE